MIKKIIMVLLLMFCMIPVIAQENDMPITREERIYNDSEARYFITIVFPNKGHPAIVSQEHNLEDAKKNGDYVKAWFDKHNRITRLELLDARGIPHRATWEYQYDEKGKIVVVISLYPNNEIKSAYRVK